MPSSKANPVISLLTDFGTSDHYVGVMKGVIAGICPTARLIDISHDVAAYQIAQGAYLLSQAWRWFPTGSVHLAVVDPGVGSGRRAIAAEAAGHFFVLPDNGLLSLADVPSPRVYAIINESLLLHPVTRTFHGRDVFAPVAAHLAAGLPLEQTGPPVEDWIRLGTVLNRVLHIDRFGNVITSLRPAEIEGRRLFIGSQEVSRRAAHYAEAPRGELLLLIGSGGFVEISERESSAARRLQCRVGDAVRLAPDDKM